jgi:hypothetical protein
LVSNEDNLKKKKLSIYLRLFINDSCQRLGLRADDATVQRQGLAIRSLQDHVTVFAAFKKTAPD